MNLMDAPATPGLDEAARREKWLSERGSVGQLLTGVGGAIARGEIPVVAVWKEFDPFGATQARKDAQAEDEATRVRLAREQIDTDEAKWLAERILRDGAVDENERALLAFLKKEAPAIDPVLAGVMKRAGLSSAALEVASPPQDDDCRLSRISLPAFLRMRGRDMRWLGACSILFSLSFAAAAEPVDVSVCTGKAVQRARADRVVHGLDRCRQYAGGCLRVSRRGLRDGAGFRPRGRRLQRRDQAELSLCGRVRGARACADRAAEIRSGDRRLQPGAGDQAARGRLSQSRLRVPEARRLSQRHCRLQLGAADAAAVGDTSQQPVLGVGRWRASTWKRRSAIAIGRSGWTTICSRATAVPSSISA